MGFKVHVVMSKGNTMYVNITETGYQYWWGTDEHAQVFSPQELLDFRELVPDIISEPVYFPITSHKPKVKGYIFITHSGAYFREYLKGYTKLLKEAHIYSRTEIDSIHPWSEWGNKAAGKWRPVYE
jgi:hypothetical protein